MTIVKGGAVAAGDRGLPQREVSRCTVYDGVFLGGGFG